MVYGLWFGSFGCAALVQGAGWSCRVLVGWRLLLPSHTVSCYYAAIPPSFIARGDPDFVEIKGMTFPGVAESFPQMTMYNVPFHHEVVAFSTLISECLNGSMRECIHAR